MKPLVDRLGVVGVGLIGGSLALAAKRLGLAREVVGLGRTCENLQVALDRGLIDRGDVDPAVIAGAELVVLATPLDLLESAALAVAPHLPDGAIVTDAGSAKAAIVGRLTESLSPRLRFVGGHPIAGTELSGAGAADAELFRGARCVLTPIATTDPEAVARVRALWEAVGMEVVEMSPEEHDRVLALTSHAPHLLAFALARLARWTPLEGGGSVLDFAGPSFRDATRVAASSPETWRSILFGNAVAVRQTLASVRREVDELERAIATEDAAGLEKSISEARETRRSLDARRVRPAAGPLRGSIDVPGDKSIAHRALVLGGVARGRSIVRGVGQGEDNASTLRVLQALGVSVERRGSTVEIEGRGFDGLRAPGGTLDCGNSGTTIRFLAGLLAPQPFVATLDGDASLRARPMARVIEPLAKMGARIESRSGKPPLTIRGGAIRPARIELSIASAQVKTAVLLAGLQAEGVTSVVEPALSRDHTERLLPVFGARVERPGPLEVAVRGPVELRAAEVDVPGDPSAAAFWLVAGAIVPGSRVVVRRVCLNPTRTGALDVLRAMGARIAVEPGASVGEEEVGDLVVEAASLHGAEVAGETMLRAIDEFPVLAVAACCAAGETRFADAGELRVKESDRLRAMAEGLRKLGAALEEHPDGMTIRGPTRFTGGVVESHGDHRVAMAFAIAALVAAAPVAIRDAEAIAVSYPEFLATLESLREGAA